MNTFRINTDYKRLFHEFESGLNGLRSGSLHKKREQAIDQFIQEGFPSTEEEEWRFTDVSPIAETEFRTVKAAEQRTLNIQTVRSIVADTENPRLVFENGHFCQDLSQIPVQNGITVKSMFQAVHENRDLVETYAGHLASVQKNGFVALNTAFLYDGAFIKIPDSVIIESPIYIIYITKPVSGNTAVFPRNLILLGGGARATIVEHYTGIPEHSYFNNTVTEIFQEQNSVLDHIKIQRESGSAYHTALTQVQQERGSVYKSSSFSFGSRLSRNDIHAQLKGEGTETVLNGLYLSSGRSLTDHHTFIDHAAPHSSSRELYKGILDGKARAVFSGKIHVRQKAQKTDAQQSNENLILSKDAVVDTKPQLEILADDVRCTHGSTVGQMNKDGLFYLRSRGLSLTAARNLMIRAFAAEVTEQIKHDRERESLDQLINSRLTHGHLQ